MKSNNSNERPIVEATLESGEVVADILMRGDVLAEIPLIGTAIKICKAADSIRDQTFALKLSRFILNFENITEKQKTGLRIKLNAGTEEAQRIGETLLFVLERVTDLSKPVLLSQILLAYVDSVISSEELRRLCQAVDVAFADDLNKFLTVIVIPEDTDEPWMRSLVFSGLTQLASSGMFDDAGRLYCEITPLGQKLRNIYPNKYNPSQEARSE